MKDILDEAELLGTPGGERLRLRFSGPFEGRTVCWDTELVTLAAWRRQHPQHNADRNFIDIGEESEQGVAITIGLGLPTIDLPTVRKAMMMVRQYKRLRRGLHEYGPQIPL